jgi:ketosteroid isomerase-like protein
VADKMISKLVAEADIRALAMAYASAVDRLDAAAMGAIFADDAVMQGPGWAFHGVAEIKGVIDMLRTSFEKTWHAVHNHHITLSDDHQSATGEVYCMARHIVRGADDASAIMTMIIRYQDQYVASGGAWKISARTLDLDWMETSALSRP